MSELNTTNKLTEELIKGKIIKAEYIKMGEKTTICCLTLENGFEVIGTSSCVDVLNFNDVIGRDLAYENAVDKVWELEGYLLQNTLSKLP